MNAHNGLASACALWEIGAGPVGYRRAQGEVAEGLGWLGDLAGGVEGVRPRRSAGRADPGEPQMVTRCWLQKQFDRYGEQCGELLRLDLADVAFTI